MGLLLDIGLGAAQGALRGALHPFAAAGDITSAQADELAAGAIDLFKMLEAAAKHPAPLDIRAAIRGLLDGYVSAGDVTPAKADEITSAILDAIGLGQKLMAKPPAPGGAA